MQGLKWFLLILLFMFSIQACAPVPNAGTENGKCNNAGICLVGLVCDTSRTPPLCVRPENVDGGIIEDGGTDASVSITPINPSNPNVSQNKQIQFNATVSGSDNKKIDWRATAGNISEDGLFTAPSSPGDVTIKATAYADPEKYSTTTAHVVALPEIASFTADKYSLLFGESVDLRPVFADGKGVIDQGVGSVSSGYTVSVSPTVTTTYKLTVTNEAGDKTEKSLTITVSDVAVSDISPANASVSVGKTKQFSSTVSGAVDTTVVWSIEQGGGTIDENGLLTAPGTPGEITIKAASKADPTKFKTAVVKIVPLPSITSFSASKSKIDRGESNTLTGVFNDGMGAVNNGVGTVQSGVGKDVSPLVTTEYNLTVTNPAGDSVDAKTTVNVAVVSVAVSPIEPGVTVGGTIQFGATVTGAVDKTVSWKVEGGGSIDGTGKFTAPASPVDVTVTATSNSDPTKYSSTTAHVVIGPAIASFMADKTIVTVNTGTTITPVFSGGDGAIDHGIGNVTSGTGYPTGNLTADTTFTLTVTNSVSGDKVSKPLSIQVVPVPLTTVTAPQYVTSNQAGYKASVPVQGSPSTFAWTITNGTITGGADTREITFTTGQTGAVHFECKVTNQAGTEATGNADSTIVPIPDATVSTPEYVTASQGGYKASVKDQSGSSYAWTIIGGSITSAANIREVTFTAGTSGIVTLTCKVTNQAGTEDVKSGVSTIVPAPLTTVSAPQYVTENETGYIANVPAQGSPSTFEWALIGGVITSGQGTREIVFTAGSAGTVLMACDITNQAGTKATGNGNSTIVPVPKIQSFTATPDTTLYGATSTLKGVFSDGTGEIDKGIGPVNSNQCVSTPILKADTTYTLTVTNLASTSVASPTTVTVQKVEVSDITPANPSVVVGNQKQFNATVTGAVDATLSWTASAGIIDSTGLWTAPSTVPGVPVVITTTANADGKTFKSTTAQVMWETAPTVTAITPQKATNGGPVNITSLVGTGFHEGATVKLTMTGQPDIIGTSVTVINTNQITCTLNLDGAAVGNWDVVVVNNDLQSGKLTGGFEVKQIGAEWVQTAGNIDFLGRYGHSSVVFDGKIWTIGGSTGTPRNDVWYSSGEGSWTQSTASAAFPKRYSHSSVVTPDGKMWVIGGRGSAYYNDVWYSSDGSNWTLATASAAFSGRYRHTSVVTPDGKIWVIGGLYGTTSCFNDVYYSSDGTSWTQATASAAFSARSGHTSVVTPDGKIWVIGGYNTSGYINDAWYSSDGVNWTQATASAAFSGRAGHTSVVTSDGKMWVIGGFNGSIKHRDIWYSLDGSNWHQATSSADFMGRYYHTSVVTQDGKIWVIAGSAGYQLNDAWFSADGITWTQSASSEIFSPRVYHSGVVINDTIWIIGGLDSYNNPLNDVWYSNNGIEWTKATASAAFQARYHHTSVSTPDGRMWVLGGFNGTTRFNDVWYSSDGINWKQATGSALFAARYGHTSTVTPDGKLWVLGGYSSKYLNDVWFSTDGAVWTQATASADFPTRWSHTTITDVNGKMWVLGGSRGNYLNDAWYSVDGVLWTQSTQAAPFHVRANHSSAFFNNKIWVIGGASANGGVYLNDVWFSENGTNWINATGVAIASGAREGFPTLIANNRMWAIGGFSGSYLNDVWYSE